MNICVFLGSQTGNNVHYGEEVRKLGHHLAIRDIGIVYGGASIGLMGELARSALAAKGRVIGIIPRQIAHIEIPEENITELIRVDSLEERETLMFTRSDGFIALPGGIGTLEETFTVMVWCALGYHDKPVGLLNTGGYFDKLFEFMFFQSQEGFVQKSIISNLIVDDDPEQLVKRMISACSE